jgi:hypothetical protein
VRVLFRLYGKTRRNLERIRCGWIELSTGDDRSERLAFGVRLDVAGEDALDPIKILLRRVEPLPGLKRARGCVDPSFQKLSTDERCLVRNALLDLPLLGRKRRPLDRLVAHAAYPCMRSIAAAAAAPSPGAAASAASLSRRGSAGGIVSPACDLRVMPSHG